MREITLDTKIAELLSDYEGMKDILIDINPKFKKLNNPVLRRTLAKIAGVKQAAIVGGMEPIDLLNQLREAVGQAPVDATSAKVDKEPKEAPEWISKELKQTINANEILDDERNPLAELHKALKVIDEGEVIAIEADFKPEPLIDAMLKAGHEVFVQEVTPEHFVTYVKR
ncbi:hypothetical protein MNB_SV-6-65 [hydrothermal vent metagenome]|uniref:DUF1858 domain-containing protein n=1 Tax=hydrothermal vent metagenome TaxID=652676 RepID=A0A1W1BJU4_9ZZZZ